jgi:flagellar FliL protein
LAESEEHTLEPPPDLIVSSRFWNKVPIMAVTAATGEGEADAGVAENTKAKKEKKKLPLKMLIVGAAALAIIGGGAFAALKVLKGTEHAEPAPPVAKPAIFVDMPDVLVNLSNGNPDRPQYLKVKIVLEVPDQSVAAQIQPLMPRVMDAFQTYLRELRASDLEGSVGLLRLREELTRRINAAISPSQITAVLFKEIVIQ